MPQGRVEEEWLPQQGGAGAGAPQEEGMELEGQP